VLGGTLGVAVIGSVFASLYASGIEAAPGAGLLPPDVRDLAADSIGAAQIVAERVGELAGPAAGRRWWTPPRRRSWTGSRSAAWSGQA